MALVVSLPLLVAGSDLFHSNWAAAGIILLGTAPLIPLFMALVGMGLPMLDVTFSALAP